MRRRPEIMESLDRIFAEQTVAESDTFASGELSGFLQALVPLYDKPLQTVLGDRPCRVIVVSDPTDKPVLVPSAALAEVNP